MKAKANHCITILCLACFFLCMPYISHAAEWHSLAPGIDYADLNQRHLSPWSHIHAFRINLNNNQLDLVMAKALSQPHASVIQFAKYSKAFITVNGGFFDHSYHPLGLRSSHQHQYNPIKPISWWGVFYIKNQIPHISSFSHYANSNSIEFAVQSGPRLIINGHIPSLKMGLAERSALGITKDNHVILLVTENAPISTTELAEYLKAPPLYCYQAINLDGGSSSQLYARIHGFRLKVHGMSNVSDAIVVLPRS